MYYIHSIAATYLALSNSDLVHILIIVFHLIFKIYMITVKSTQYTLKIMIYLLFKEF